jgi:radical SAM superfamily enzyme YgiQ (UPF0313 family)
VDAARRINPNACLCAYMGCTPEPLISLERQSFLVPDRSDLPPLRQYVRLRMPDGACRITGYTEASRGCKHLCRHCAIVPVYNGRFRVIQGGVVMEDIRRQVASGARHITFGDPDFLNAPKHAMEIVRSLHREFPSVTFDATIKVEHLLRHADLLPELRDHGCAFVTTAMESIDDRVLERLDKGHTRSDFVRLAGLARAAGLVLRPTFVAFTPWTTLCPRRRCRRPFSPRGRPFPISRNRGIVEPNRPRSSWLP